MKHDTPLRAATAEAVWERLGGTVEPLGPEECPATEAVGAVLAADVRTAIDYPPYDRAVMDGYAVRTGDFHASPMALRLAGLSRAGSGEPEMLPPGLALQVNTGGPIPKGADAVVVVEKSRSVATATGEELVELDDNPQAEQNIERRGCILAQGDLLLRAGSRIRGGGVAAIVGAGVTRVRCFRRPRVGVLTTGDELVEHGRTLAFGQIHDSNSIVLADLIARRGGAAQRLGRCPDDVAALRTVLARGLEQDLLCVTGGMSKGSHDLVPATLEALGVRWLVTSLDLKPGKPTRIGRSPGGGWVLGLPGNPVSCAVCFILFGHAILDGLQGLGARGPAFLAGRLECDLPANGNRPMFQPAEWYAGPGGKPCVNPILWRGSGDPFGMAGANALAYRERHAPAAPRGDTIRFLALEPPT